MKLLIATACNVVLSDAQAGDSLISLLTDMTVVVPDLSAVPSNAVIPKDWCVYSKWELQPEEENRAYILRTQMFWPDGSPFNTYDLPAAQKTNGMGFNVRLNGFPIGQNGTLRVQLTLLVDDNPVSDPYDLFIKVSLAEMKS